MTLVLVPADGKLTVSFQVFPLSEEVRLRLP